MASRLTIEQKIAVVRRYLLGEHISLLSREFGVSRTIIYRWIYVYRDTKDYQFRSALKLKLNRGNKHYRKLSALKKKKLLSLDIHNSTLSLRELAFAAGVSHTTVWRLLRANSFTKPLRLTAEEKFKMIERVLCGEEKVALVCRDFRVSRTIFYRWLKIYKEASEEKRDLNLFTSKSVVHYRYVPEVRKLAQEIVISSPRISLRLMREEMIKKLGNKAVTRQTIFEVLKQLHLDSKQKRINFSACSTHDVT